jgi:hypothetical protein
LGYSGFEPGRADRQSNLHHFLGAWNLILTQAIPVGRTIKKYTAFGKADGAAGALEILPNFPSLVVPYGAYRPPWNVAGVDYYVGVNPNTQLKDWRFLTNPDLSVNIGQGVVNCSSSTTLVENVDFTTGLGGVLRNASGNATTLTINNCKFATPLPDGLYMQASGECILDFNSTSMTVKNCTFIGTDNTPRLMGNDDLTGFIYASGTLIAKYNLFYHPNQSVVSMGGAGSVAQYGITFQYNLIYNHYLTSLSHRNETQWLNAPTSSMLSSSWSFNTSFQDYPSTVSGPCTFTVAAPAVFTWTGTAGNPFVNGMPCILSGTIPGGFAANTRYWVVNASGNTFSLSSTFGGTGITSTGSPGTTQTSLSFYGSGEGIQFNFNLGTPVPFNNMNFTNNTLISRPVYQTGTGTTVPVSYWVHGDAAHSVTNSLNQQNYFDPTGAFGAYYPGSMPGWTNSGNLDMTTNRIIVPS